MVHGPVQVAPPVPHEDADCDEYGSQVPVAPPLQQPLAHEVPSQVHLPLPVLHSRPELHAVHVAPAVPHEPLVSADQASHVPVGPPLQQPCGHEVESQVHWPLPVLHSRPDVHAEQLAPPAPQDPLFSLARASHDPAVQQPAHDPPPHEHAPDAHAWPPAHALHEAPAVPHEPLDWLPYVSHAPPAVQHPLAHDDGVQTHWPAPLHVRPLLPAVQSTQATPPVPHEVPVCEAYFSHVPPLAQQPVGHVVASHEQVPLVVSHSPLEHAEHVAPAVPHDAADCDPQDSHVPFGPPLQHPLGQEFASQTHFPLLVLHSSPAAHPAQLAPAVPHDAVDSDAQASQVLEGHALHAAPPFPHDPFDSFAYVSQEPLLQHPLHRPPPQEQLPAVHVEPVPHAAQVTPPVPQELFDCADCASHVPDAVQHPLGHDAALHTHWPARLHVWPPGHVPHVAPPVPHEAPDCAE